MSKVQLKDIASFSKGSQINGDDLVDNGAYDYLNGGINPSGKWTEYNVSGGSITISEGGNSCGFVNYMVNPFWCGAHCYYLFDLKCNKKYLYYALKSQQDRIMKLRSGACMPNIKKSDIGNFVFEFDEDTNAQKQIAETLDKVTRAIDLCNTILEKMDLLVKARFVEMFGDTEANSNNYPIKNLSNLCTVSSSKRVYQNEQSSVGVPFLRISNLVGLIESGYFESDLFIPDEKYNQLFENNLVPKAGDILVTSRGTLGKCYIVQDKDKFYFQDGMISWLYDLDKSITPLYLTLLFDTKGIKRQIDNLQSGSTVAYLSITMLKKLEIVIPPIALQNQFAAFVEQTEKAKLKVKQVLEKAETLKKTLVQEYFE